MQQSLSISAVSLLVFTVAGSAQPPVQPTQNTPCHVTVPNGIAAVSPEPEQSFGGTPLSPKGSHGNRLLSAGPFGLWKDGTIIFKPGGAGFVTRDGALGMKFGWTRGVPGKLKISGRRLDGDAPPLRAEVNDAYGDLGFQPTALIFPTPGCWQVHAQVGDRADSQVTFITKVVKIGDGPAWRLN
jgi:hypothetical protein